MTEEEFVGADSTGCQYYSLHVILTMLLVRISDFALFSRPDPVQKHHGMTEEARKRDMRRIVSPYFRSRLLVSEANISNAIFLGCSGPSVFSGSWVQDPVQEHYGMTEGEFVGADSTGRQYYSLHVILTMLLVRISDFAVFSRPDPVQKHHGMTEEARC